jgi:hypothetical protein
MCDYENLLINTNAPGDKIDCKLATVFNCPPPLPKLGILLSIIAEESPRYLVQAVRMCLRVLMSTIDLDIFRTTVIFIV